jgi:hypothetical protein
MVADHVMAVDAQVRDAMAAKMCDGRARCVG